MASRLLDALLAIDEALHLGWTLHISGGANDNNLIVVEVTKPRDVFIWTTIYSTGGIFDALARTGETLREVLS